MQKIEKILQKINFKKEKTFKYRFQEIAFKITELQKQRDKLISGDQQIIFRFCKHDRRAEAVLRELQETNKIPIKYLKYLMINANKRTIGVAGQERPKDDPDFTAPKGD